MCAFQAFITQHKQTPRNENYMQYKRVSVYNKQT